VPFTSGSTWIAPDFRRLAMKMRHIAASDSSPRKPGTPACLMVQG
jgi:hypothetical protein